MPNTLSNPNDNIPPLTSFEITIPNLAIMTGLNGSGKSRLIEAVKSGQISYLDENGIKISHEDIDVISNPGSLIPFKGTAAAVGHLTQLMSLGKVDVRNQQRATNALIAKYQNDGLTPIEAREAVFNDLKKRKKPNNDETKHNELDKFLTETQLSINKLREKGFSIENSDIPHLVMQAHLPNRTRNQLTVLVPHSFALINMFEEWRKQREANLYNSLKKIHAEGGQNALSWKKFHERYGKAPWTVLNNLLEKMGSKLRFHINEEGLSDRDIKFTQLQLKDEKGTIFSADKVSTGERIIFLIVLYRYAKTAENITYRTPKLLLLDELDAHLHPSLNGTLLELLKDTFIENGSKIIFATHSPASVSLTAEDSIILLKPYAKPVMGSRREALNILMTGQEKMFIDLSGSKIIFVEDQSDVEILELLVGRYTEKHHKSRLVFKSLSKKTTAGSEDGGKGTVKKILKILGADKNVAGLIDFDGKEKAGSGIFILCGGERYGIENLLLDPRILIYILLRNDTNKWAKRLRLDIQTLNEFNYLSDEDIQMAINELEKVLFDEVGKKINVTYDDGKVFEISQKVLKTQCHDYEELVETKLRLSKKLNDKNVCKKISEQIIPEISGCVPASLKNTFEELLTA